MRHPRAFRLTLWVLAALSALTLLVWLVVVLGQTTLTLDSSRGEATAETTLGQLECRKTLTTSFPFVALACQDEEQR